MGLWHLFNLQVRTALREVLGTLHGEGLITRTSRVRASKTPALIVLPQCTNLWLLKASRRDAKPPF